MNKLIWIMSIVVLSLVLALHHSIVHSQTAHVDNLSTNVQGSNVSNNSNNTNNSNAVTYNGNAPGSIPTPPPPSAISPSFMAGGTDSCLMGYGGSVSTSIIGISGGSYVRDEQCEMLKLAKTLNDFGLKVAAVATLCQDERVFRAMAMAGTPCPYLGTIGSQATALWIENPRMRPDYARFRTLKPIALDKPLEEAATSNVPLSTRFRYSTRSNIKYECCS